MRFKRFPVDTSLETVRRWRLDTRASLRSAQRPKGTLAADIEPFLRQIADRPRLVAERRQQLEWWAACLGHLRRDAIEPGDVRTALADLRRTHAASTCNHYRQALFSLYQALDGRDAPNPVRDVKPFASPAPEARGLSYDTVRRILAAMSDQGSAMVKGKPRAGASAAKVRCRVLAFTGLRPSELMRYRPEHWDRTTQTLVVYTGKGGRTRTIPLSAPAVEALADLEALGAIGTFSTSTVWRAFVRAAARIGDSRGTALRPPSQLRHGAVSSRGGPRGWSRTCSATPTFGRRSAILWATCRMRCGRRRRVSRSTSALRARRKRRRTRSRRRRKLAQKVSGCRNLLQIKEVVRQTFGLLSRGSQVRILPGVPFILSGEERRCAARRRRPRERGGERRLVTAYPLRRLDAGRT